MTSDTLINSKNYLKISHFFPSVMGKVIGTLDFWSISAVLVSSKISTWTSLSNLVSTSKTMMISIRPKIHFVRFCIIFEKKDWLDSEEGCGKFIFEFHVKICICLGVNSPRSCRLDQMPCFFTCPTSSLHWKTLIAR